MRSAKFDILRVSEKMNEVESLSNIQKERETVQQLEETKLSTINIKRKQIPIT
jgi:predicted fused transcriptional regulator/phosphomethylpyrimidine kinase